MTSWTRSAMAGVLLLAALQASAQSEWTLTRLPSLLGDTGNSSASAINNVGQVVGSSWGQDRLETNAVLWQDGHVNYLGSLSGASAARDINDAGQVVGSSLGLGGTDVAHYRATLWQGGRITELPRLGGSGFSGAEAINASGVVVGYSYGDRAVPVVWNNGQPTAIPLPPGGFDNGSSVGINTSGQILFNSDPPPSAFMGREGAFTDLGHLFPATPWTFAAAINDAGQVVGSSVDLSSGTWHAFLWEDGQMSDLGVPAGFSDSVATAINASGQVVGRAFRDNPATGHAILWDGERIVDLTLALGGATAGRSLHPNDINDAGVIVGDAVGPGLESYAFMLTPVPEPATSMLLLAGGALVWRLRKKAKAGSATTQRCSRRYALQCRSAPRLSPSFSCSRAALKCASARVGSSARQRS